MVQNKQKSNKINITAIITCFMLIMVFVFGCVQYANAANNLTVADVLAKYNGSSSMYIGSTQYNSAFGEIAFVDCLESFSGNICGYFYTDDRGSTSWGIVSDNPFVVHRVDKNGDFSEYILDSKSSVSGSDDRAYYSFTSATYNNILDYETSILTFSNVNDAYNYIDTGEINNPIYQPTIYDNNIPTPSNITLTFNCEFGDSFKLEEIGHPFTMTWDNIQNGENQVNYDDLTFECYVDMGYWAYKDIFGHHNDKTTGKIKLFDSSATSKYKTCDRLGKNSDWDTWFSSIKLDVNAFGMLGQYYDFYCRYVDSSGNYGNWVKIHVSGSNSTINRKWGVIKDIDATTTINKGYEEIDGNNGEHVSGDYDNYYVGNSDGNFSNNLTSLKNNYSNLINFFKELFGFLPAEIWVILLGVVSTMALIAILIFVRG